MNEYRENEQNQENQNQSAQNVQQNNGEYHYAYRPATPTYQPTYTAPTNNTDVPPYEVKPKKERKKYGFGTLIAAMLCVAVLCGSISAGVTATLMKNNIADSVSEVADKTVSDALKNVSTDKQQINTGNTNITINDTSDSIATTVAQKVLGSVVGIQVTSTETTSFFGRSYSAESTSEGSGVIYREDGYIITNYHVISSAVDEASYGKLNNDAKIDVYFYNEENKAYSASVVGYDAGADIALIKVERTGLQAMEIGDSSALSVGEVTIAVGCPGGLDFMGSVSKGIISGLNRSITTESGVEMNLIQTDAAINPGNSGGALVNAEGKLIGVNNSKMTGEFEGMCFAIPVNEVVELCDRMINKEGAAEAYLGITVNTYYTSDRLNSMGYPSGVVVYSVAEGSPAEEAGIEQGDLIVAINGKEITSYATMISEKNKYDAGETITVSIYNGKSNKDVRVTLG